MPRTKAVSSASLGPQACGTHWGIEMGRAKGHRVKACVPQPLKAHKVVNLNPLQIQPLRGGFQVTRGLQMQNIADYSSIIPD